MSKIAEKKALETYPKMSRISEPHGIIPADNKSHRLGDANEENREAFIKGYEQAMQDFLEKADKFFNEELFTRFSGEEHRVASNKCMNLQQFIEQFKNYMENESEE